jgi:hypothetical protein
MPNPDTLARHYAKQIAAALEVEIGDTPAYTYADTAQAAAWPLVDNRYDARLAVNVETEDRPYGIVETGLLDEPQFQMFVVRYLGAWVEADDRCRGPNLSDARGANHPALRRK